MNSRCSFRASGSSTRRRRLLWRAIPCGLLEKGPMKTTHSHSLGPASRQRRRLTFSLGEGRFRARPAVFLFLLLPLAHLQSAQLQEARVSQVIRDVKLLPQRAAPRPAVIRDEVSNGTAVRTGVESRAELTFADQTLARLGANSIFTFNEGTRNLELSGGAMLLRVPKDAGGAQIHTSAITAAITGTTIMLEYRPDAFIKFIVLEGTTECFSATIASGSQDNGCVRALRFSSGIT